MHCMIGVAGGYADFDLLNDSGQAQLLPREVLRDQETMLCFWRASKSCPCNAKPGSILACLEQLEDAPGCEFGLDKTSCVDKISCVCRHSSGHASQG